jgi:SAM-dependent methyltransferase
MRPAFSQSEEAAGYSEAGKKNLEILEDAKLYNAYIERFLRKFIAPFYMAVDFGAGGGEFARRLVRAGVDVTCVELDPGLQQRLRDAGLKVTGALSSCAGARRVYSLNVLEHMEDDRAALKDIYDTLAPGGELLLYVPAFMQIYTEVDRAVGHHRRYTKPELTGKLKDAGFEIKSARYVDSLGFFAWLMLKWMGQAGGEINGAAVIFYDRFCFPISLIGDFFLHRWIGKNVLVVAGKP